MGYYQIYWWLHWQLVCCVPVFWAVVSGQIRYSIPEELQPGAFVGNIADDLGLRAEELSARNFRVVPGPRKQYLEINLDNGILYVKEKIDREQLCGPILVCMIFLEAVIEKPLTVYHVEVELVDVNDNAPRFPNSQLRLKISELAPAGARFALEYAHDPDFGTNSLQTYQLVANGYFALNIDSRGGDGKLPVLLLERPLDREKQSTHRLELIAKDGGIPPNSGTAEIMIVVQDENDNAPVFSNSSYRVSLLENSPRGTLLIKLNATDLDDGRNGAILYSFSSQTSVRVRELFNVDSKTGQIRVKGDLDYEEVTVFEINVQALDQGINANIGYCHVFVNIIDVNDNAPEVTLTYLFSPVSEDSKVGTVIALISVSDKDSEENGQVDCELAKNLPFRLDSSLRNYYRLLTGQLLNRENISKFDLSIICNDSGFPPLSTRKTIRVEISDINDNAPHFTQTAYTAYVMENNVIGTSVFAVTALVPDLNQNSRLFYSILESQVQSEPVSSYVKINSENGVIFSQRAFDYEQLKNFKIHVQARDSGVPPLVNNTSVDVIILDQNDNAPLIIHPFVEYGSTALETVSRLAEPGYLVTKVKQPNADWHFAQTHRAELNSAQYLEEEGVQREIQREVQREVQCDVQREVPRDVQCDVPHNIQREVQRDVQCDMQRVVEKDPGGPRKPMCARPVAIPAGRDGWTLPRTAPRMQLQMTLGAHVPGTLRSQYLIPRELHTSGARISNSSVEFSAPLIGSLHGPMAANQTRDHRGISSPGSRRPELDPQARGEIPCSPTGQRLSTQRLHSRDHDHALREVNY
ncbi:protocadherin-10-like isoform X36 [Scyliorhinus canicula]|uniref:protocadherin-10-like isoform X36 n=1 Tax=Scyliorhinus canicula TaxID=7830 RepID=UPI0018F56A70|nr:protocadherin-10-like isoform X36 [Scyliorhinus canicula]